MKKIIILLYISISISGCAWVVDFPRSLWGSSIRVLSDQRKDAETKIFSCDRDVCFDAVLAMTRPNFVLAEDEADEADKTDERFVLFMKDARKRYIVVMGVPGAVDTTEVGIFFNVIKDGQTKIDISSLSSRAKQEAARRIFEKLSEACPTAL